MDAAAKAATSMSFYEIRNCPKCRKQVDNDVEVCPYCQSALFETVSTSFFASIRSYFFGGLMGGIALGIVRGVEWIAGFNNQKLEMIVFGIVTISAWGASKARNSVKRDLCKCQEDVVNKHMEIYNRLSDNELLELKSKLNDSEYTKEAIKAFHQVIKERHL